MTLDPAAVAVIVSGIVAVASLSVPLLTSLLSDRQKWKRDLRSNALNGIDHSSLALLERLNDYWANNYLSSGVLHPNMSDWRQLKSQLMSRYSAWEQAVWEYLDDSERMTVRNMRKELLLIGGDEKPDQADYTAYIHDLSNSAKTRVK